MQQACNLGRASHAPNTSATVTGHEWGYDLYCSNHHKVSGSYTRAVLCFGWTQGLWAWDRWEGGYQMQPENEAISENSRAKECRETESRRHRVSPGIKSRLRPL